MRIEGAWIDNPETREVCAMLTRTGHQALFVGGCVRNALLCAPVQDVDIATDARPEVIMDLARESGMRAVPTGLEHGTVTVINGHKPYEITTFRKDVRTFGRKAQVEFSSDLHEDARRRDFTMNALYAMPDGELVDPLDGLGDLIARRVRFIEDADQRIREDYLRILRFFRFHAWYGDPHLGLDADGLAACAAGLDGLSGLSRERVGGEVRKILSAPDPAPSLAAMQASGVLNAILPGADARGLALLIHYESVSDMAPDAILRLASLGGCDVEARLRLSRSEAKRLVMLRSAAEGTMQAPELGYRHGVSEGARILMLRAAFLSSPLPEGMQDDLARGAAAFLPIRADDLKDRFSGPALGRKLAETERRWIESGFTLSRDDLL